MKVSFNGIGDRLVTFINDSTNAAKKGEVVKVSAAGTVSKCSSGDGFDGVAAFVDGGYAGVHLRGFVTVGYSGDTAPSVGHNLLVADGSGGVKVDSTDGKDYLAVAADTAGKTVTILM